MRAVAKRSFGAQSFLWMFTICTIQEMCSTLRIRHNINAECSSKYQNIDTMIRLVGNRATELNIDHIREVPWETRNLRRPAFELDNGSIEVNVLRSSLDRITSDIGADFFVQAKVPSIEKRKVAMLESVGFRFAEMSLDPSLRIPYSDILVDYEISPEKFLKSSSDVKFLSNECGSVVDLSEATRNEIVRVSTTVFKDDRFHMDPNCPSVLADERIGLWVKEDLLTDKNVLCTLLRFRERLVGYIIWKGERFILGGISQGFLGKGFAKALYLQTLLDVKRYGVEEISATISVNNISVLNLYSRLGFSFGKPTYLLHYWGSLN